MLMRTQASFRQTILIDRYQSHSLNFVTNSFGYKYSIRDRNEYE